ncbi:hypothetical protein EMIT0P218_140046 [Pseudomonas sp. IT-P218]
MRVILINVARQHQVLYAADAQKDSKGGVTEEKKPNSRHKKPRPFDQGLCYRLEVASGFLRSSKAFSGPWSRYGAADGTRTRDPRRDRPVF